MTVSRNGETVVTIETNCLSGRELSAEDEEVIRTAARHLMSFVGEAPAEAWGDTMLVTDKVTIDQLEEMLRAPDGMYSIEIQADGSIRAVEGVPNHAAPKVLTALEVLGSDC